MSFNPSMLELAFNQDEMCPDDGDQSASGGIRRDGSRVANRRTLESAALLSQIQVNLHLCLMPQNLVR